VLLVGHFRLGQRRVFPSPRVCLMNTVRSSATVKVQPEDHI